jgi:hypothetical protein
MIYINRIRTIQMFCHVLDVLQKTFNVKSSGYGQEWDISIHSFSFINR